MKIALKVMLLCGLLSLAGYPAIAQTQSSPCASNGKLYGPLMVNSVTGCPFSAVVEILHTQTLGDGSHIRRKIKALSYRDSLGRVRYESFAIADDAKDSSEALHMIEIYDPVAGFHYLILPHRTTVYRSGLNPAVANPSAGETLQSWPSRPQPSSFGPDTKSKRVVENLGSQQMQGLLVNGTRATTTIPVGAEGNDRELTVITEDWISPDLGLMLLRKRFDLRSDDSEMRVTSLGLGEPDAALFHVPTDYTIAGQ